MLKESFIFLDRISQKTERNIWRHAQAWDDFQSMKRIPGFSAMRKGYYDRRLKEAESALKQENVQHFAEKLPLSETWRLYNEFKDDAVFLDIETSSYYGDVTMIGLSNGESFKPLVRGFNLNQENIHAALKDAKLIMTFNGASFDIPVIQRYFKTSLSRIPHIDLRHVCSKVGLNGGLKIIEKQIGIRREAEIQGVSGGDAVWLWQAFQYSKNPKYLDTLVAYNQADVENLKQLAEFSIPMLWRKVRLLDEVGH